MVGPGFRLGIATGVSDAWCMKRPLLLLDVDGVLFPLGSGPDGERMHDVVLGGWSPVSFSALVPDRLMRLSHMYRLAWGTAWGQSANDLIAPLLGLPPLPVCDLSDADPPAGTTWKLPAIASYLGDRSGAWIDDEIGGDALQWAATRTHPTAFVRTDPHIGMTDEHVQILLAHAEACRAEATR